ncbi:MAG: hypothetical protein HFI89_03530 [Lachnospiraceae bacterium]|nr:hypothetical protein [Lachnospiraceae bacterium]
MINSTHKDRLFTFLFGREENREWTLSLYNAVNHTCYTDSGEIEFTTMDDAVYMGMKNDLSFLMHSFVSVYEHQSSYNPNLPVRELMYAGRLYDKHIHQHRLNIYGTKTVVLPVPKLVAFYNGTDEKEDEVVLRLSDAFPEGMDKAASDIEVKVRMLNVNHGHNRKLMEACGPLAEYAWFVEEIRKNKRKSMTIEAAVDQAINDMPENYVIKTYLTGNRAEVKNMCITEYNEAETMQMFKEEGREEGWKDGQIEGRREGEDKFGKLMEILLGAGRTSDARKAASDREERMRLYKEFGID